MNNDLKILIADDHIVLRDALAQLVNTFEGCNVIDTADNGRDMIIKIELGNVPQLVILDLNMPVMDGYDAAKWLYENYPQIKVIVLTMYDSEIPLIRLLTIGVRGFLKKDVSPSVFKEAILSVAKGGYYYSHNTTAKLSGVFKKTQLSNIALDKAILSPIEMEFLKLASTEMTYKEIAFALDLTPRSIDNYRDTLFEKLEVKSRVGLAIYAVKNGVVTF